MVREQALILTLEAAQIKSTRTQVFAAAVTPKHTSMGSFLAFEGEVFFHGHETLRR